MARKANDNQLEKINRDETVKIRIPKESGEENTFYIAINGQSFLIPRGKTVEVPAAVAAIYDEYLASRDTEDDYADEEQKRMNKIEGAPV